MWFETERSKLVNLDRVTVVSLQSVIPGTGPTRWYIGAGFPGGGEVLMSGLSTEEEGKIAFRFLVADLAAHRTLLTAEMLRTWVDETMEEAAKPA